MNAMDLYSLLPMLVTAVSAVAVMLLIAFYRNHLATLVLTLAALSTAFVSLAVCSGLAPRKVTGLLVIDGYSIFYMGLVFAAGFAVALLSYGYLDRREEDKEEYYLLLLLAALGASVLVSAGHFASFLLGLETMSVSLYGMIAYPRRSPKSIEAGVKYLILAAASDAFLVFGMALIYLQTGTLQFSRMALSLSGPPGAMTGIGLGMLITGIGFKLSLVPFHMWISDVYEGAPAPVTAFLATVSKGAMFALLFRYFAEATVQDTGSLLFLFTVIATASMFTGNLLALFQNNVKRILAYSSIAHFGYLLVAFLASGPAAVTAVSYYLTAYFATTLGAFGVITVLSGRDGEPESLNDFRGLARRRPWLCAIFTGMLLSLAGIPLTAGFVGKFFVMKAGLGSDLWWLVTMLIINSVIGLAYYLRVLITLYLAPMEDQEIATETSYRSLTGGAVLAGLVLLVLWFGVYPSSLLRIISSTILDLL
jgi:NADH-quinone oxidoreductase subunit N